MITSKNMLIIVALLIPCTQLQPMNKIEKKSSTQTKKTLFKGYAQVPELEPRDMIKMQWRKKISDALYDQAMRRFKEKLDLMLQAAEKEQPALPNNRFRVKK